MARTTPDFYVENHGSIFLFRPITLAARKHLRAVADAAPEVQFFGSAMVVEPRYVQGVIESMTHPDNGFTVR